MCVNIYKYIYIYLCYEKKLVTKATLFISILQYILIVIKNTCNIETTKNCELKKSKFFFSLLINFGESVQLLIVVLRKF